MKRFILIVLTAAMVLPVHGQNTSRAERRRNELQKEIEIINRQLKENAKSSTKALSNLTLVQRKIETRKTLLSESDMEIKQLTDSIQLREEQIRRLSARKDTLEQYYYRLIRGAYRSRDSRTWYMYILASENLGQAFRRTAYLRGLSAEMNRQAAELISSREELDRQKDTLLMIRRSAELLRSERARDVSLLQGEEQQAKTLIGQLQADRNRYQNDLRKKSQEVDALNREIAEIIRKATEKQNKPSTGKSTKGMTEVDTKLSGKFASNKGRLPWPAEGTVIDTYGQHYHPVYKNVKLPFNNGVTLAVDNNAPVRAVFDGVVAQIIVMPGYNQCVLVRHGEYFTFYCKLGEAAVKSGDKVKTGQILGYVAPIGGENQLHFQLWKGRTPQNPENWLK